MWGGVNTTRGAFVLGAGHSDEPPEGWRRGVGTEPWGLGGEGGGGGGEERRWGEGCCRLVHTRIREEMEYMYGELVMYTTGTLYG